MALVRSPFADVLEHRRGEALRRAALAEHGPVRHGVSR